jgi:hypothetical protein
MLWVDAPAVVAFVQDMQFSGMTESQNPSYSVRGVHPVPKPK